MMLKNTVFAGVVVLAGACSTPAQTSSSSHWVECESNADCAPYPAAVECDQGYCVDSGGHRLVVSDGGDDGSGGERGIDASPSTGGGGGQGVDATLSSGGSGGESCEDQRTSALASIDEAAGDKSCTKHADCAAAAVGVPCGCNVGFRAERTDAVLAAIEDPASAFCQAPPSECIYPDIACQPSAGQCLDGECVSATFPHCEDTSDVVLGGSRSFGECTGSCVFDLELDLCQAATLRIRETFGGPVLQTNYGFLPRDLAQLADLIADDLIGVTLDETYGCPDCTDGGAATVQLRRGGTTTVHQYEYNNAPAVLMAADAYVQNVIDGLRACDPSIGPEPGCVPEP